MVLTKTARMPSLGSEISRRNVVRVGIAYMLMAWVLLQAVDFGLDVIDAPNWIMQLLVLLAAIGPPGVLVFAWVFEMTPEGLKRESEISREESITHVTGRKLNTVIIGVLVLAVVLLGGRLLMDGAAPATAPSAASPTAESRSYDSVVVLPFADYSEAGDQEYFSKGIAVPRWVDACRAGTIGLYRPAGRSGSRAKAQLNPLPRDFRPQPQAPEQDRATATAGQGRQRQAPGAAELGATPQACVPDRYRGLPGVWWKIAGDCEYRGTRADPPDSEPRSVA